MTEQDPAAIAIFESIRTIGDAFRPIMVAKEGSGGRKASGTAIVVGHAATRFVLTAEHVVSGPQAKFMGVIEEDSVPWPTKYSRLVGTNEELPDPDVAWATTTVNETDVALKAHLPIALARAAIPDSTESNYVAVGYPVSKSKLWHSEGRLATKLMTAVVKKASADEMGNLAIDDRVQMAFTYTQHSRTDLEGNATVGSHPRGMSGGAILAMMQAGNPPNAVALPFLVGILTNFHDDVGVLIATRVSHIWNAIPSLQVSKPLYLRATVPNTR